MPERSFQITIINDSRQVACEADCGIDWSSPEATALASQRINDRFGKGIELAYLNLAEADNDIHEWNDKIRKNNLSLPLLVVNDQLRISGPFDIRQLLDTIEAEIEIMD